LSETVFTKVDYYLSGLIEYIEIGDIGLPDMQRPFVWNNAKVRDLFDSMYKGYPVGYLLFWQNGLAADDRSIGANAKQKVPKLVIVDGQQRLTSLYAVVKGISVYRENYESEFIKIAFNPLEEKFEVSDAAIQRDAAYIPDIINGSVTMLFIFMSVVGSCPMIMKGVLSTLTVAYCSHLIKYAPTQRFHLFILQKKCTSYLSI